MYIIEIAVKEIKRNTIIKIIKSWMQKIVFLIHKDLKLFGNYGVNSYVKPRKENSFFSVDYKRIKTIII